MLPLIQPSLLNNFNFWKCLFLFMFQATNPWCQNLDFGCQLSLLLHKFVSDFSLPNSHFRLINPFKLFASPPICFRIIKYASLEPSSGIFLGPRNPPCKGNSTATIFRFRIFATRRRRHSKLIAKKLASFTDLLIRNQGERKKGETRKKNNEFGFSKKKSAAHELGIEESRRRRV